MSHIYVNHRNHANEWFRRTCSSLPLGIGVEGGSDIRFLELFRFHFSNMGVTDIACSLSSPEFPRPLAVSTLKALICRCVDSLAHTHTLSCLPQMPTGRLQVSTSTRSSLE